VRLDVPHLLPHIPIPTNDPEFARFWQKNLPYHAANEAYLAYLSMCGLRSMGLDRDPKYLSRIKHELQVIWNMAVTDYFLIQNKAVEFMKSAEIMYGIRGSGVGSLVLYALGVNRVCDPLRWNLLFERFLNPGRGEQYKVDLSCFPWKQWFAEHGKVDQIQPSITLKKLIKEKASDPEFDRFGPAISKELWVLENQGFSAYLCDLAGRGLTTTSNECNLWSAYFLGITNKKPDGDLIVRKVATLPDVDTDIADNKRGIVIDWAKREFGADHVAMISTWNTYQARAAVKGALKVSERFNTEWGEERAHHKAEEITKSIPVRQQPPMTIEDAIAMSEEFAYYYRRYTEEIETAKKLVGVNSNLGVHAGGVLIASEPIHDHAPIENSKGTLASAFDMASVERVGIVKYDYLGLATYQMVQMALDFIKKRKNLDIDLTKIDLNDKDVLKLYADGNTASLFQFASSGMQKALKEVKVDHIEDLIAVNALFRPGPLQYIPDYAAGKRNPSSIQYAHPLIKKHLEVTFGIMVYQEQAMLLCMEMADLDWDEVDKIRKAVSKKDGELFAKITSVFMKKALGKGMPETAVNNVLSIMEKFSGYAFNRSHSAGYSLLSYWTAYLRKYHPAEWLAACIHVERDDDDKMAIYRRECQSLRIPVQTPSVNESTFETTVSQDGRILLPLNAIKGVGALAQCIIDNQPFENLKDFCYRARPNVGVVKALAENHALDCFPEAFGRSADEIMEMYNLHVDARTRDDKAAAKAAKAKFHTISPFDDDEKGDDEGRPVHPDLPRGPRTQRPRRNVAPINRNLFDGGLLN
jgi:DNA polymerase III alpha subunit